jgi:hypothetical protein
MFSPTLQAMTLSKSAIMPHMRRRDRLSPPVVMTFAWIGISALLSGCEAINPPNQVATLSAQNTAFAVEATVMAADLAATQAALVGTQAAAQSMVSDMTNINRQLQATALAIIPPTAERQIGIAAGAEAPISSPPPDMVGMDDVVGEGGAASTGYTESLLTTNIQESDGCALDSQTQFFTSSPTIYAITRAASITAGTTVTAEWRTGDQVINQSYSADTDQANFCIWFPLDPTAVPFVAGDWTVALAADGVPIQSLPFTIVDG